MDIKTLQLKFLDILKDRYVPENNEEYFKAVLVSKNLKILKDIIYFWRASSIENYCYLTSICLKKLNLFEEKVKEYYLKNNFSSYIEKLGTDFLLYLSKDEDEIISFVSNFEYLLIDVKSGSRKEYFIETWYDPAKIFDFLLTDSNFFPQKEEKKYALKLSENIKDYFEILNVN